jgi:hypothetical protein
VVHVSFCGKPFFNPMCDAFEIDDKFHFVMTKPVGINNKRVQAFKIYNVFGLCRFVIIVFNLFTKT